MVISLDGYRTMDAFKLYNDLKFRGKADSIAKELAYIDPSSNEYNAKKEAHDAMVENILNDPLKPKES
jgi:hypothetical protein